VLHARRAAAPPRRRRRRPSAYALTLQTPHPPNQRAGFLALPFASADEVAHLRARALELIAQADLTAAAASVFSTVRQQQKVHSGAYENNAATTATATAEPQQQQAANGSFKSSDDHFLGSAGRVCFFLEEKAVDPLTGALLRQHLDRGSAVNKIGHALHDLDPSFRAFSRSPRICSLLRSLNYAKPLPVQSMYILKGPRIGGEVSPHRDDSFLATEPRPSVVGLWLALEPADRSNGCLWAVPGSHRDGGGVPERRFVLREVEGGDERQGGGGGAEGAEGGGEGEARSRREKRACTLAFTAPQPEYDLSQAVPIECPAGTLVLLHGHVLHYSGENTSPVSRHSYAAHYVEGGKGMRWRGDNWLQRRGNGGGGSGSGGGGGGEDNEEAGAFEPLYDDGGGDG
jgi:phytanoyl-CoA hydroxylase